MSLRHPVIICQTLCSNPRLGRWGSPRQTRKTSFNQSHAPKIDPIPHVVADWHTEHQTSVKKVSHWSCNSHITIPSPTESYHCNRYHCNRLSNMVYQSLNPLTVSLMGFSHSLNEFWDPDVCTYRRASEYIPNV